MGSLGANLDALAEKELGSSWWQEHGRAISLFWDQVAHFFNSLDVRGLKVYQDGLVANGADGLRIIREGINRGSRNYEIVGKLLEREAVLVKTEDPVLVKQEYAYIAKMAGSKSEKEKEAWALRYKLAQGRLLMQRDDFIARRIRETLGEGETGVLFIGAYHDILSKLPSDIQVTQVRDVAKTRQCHKTLATEMDNSI
jgi:hypothetical protein